MKKTKIALILCLICTIFTGFFNSKNVSAYTQDRYATEVRFLHSQNNSAWLARCIYSNPGYGGQTCNTFYSGSELGVRYMRIYFDAFNAPFNSKGYLSFMMTNVKSNEEPTFIATGIFDQTDINQIVWKQTDGTYGIVVNIKFTTNTQTTGTSDHFDLLTNIQLTSGTIYLFIAQPILRIGNDSYDITAIDGNQFQQLLQAIQNNGNGAVVSGLNDINNSVSEGNEAEQQRWEQENNTTEQANQEAENHNEASEQGMTLLEGATQFVNALNSVEDGDCQLPGDICGNIFNLGQLNLCSSKPSWWDNIANIVGALVFAPATYYWSKRIVERLIGLYNYVQRG